MRAHLPPPERRRGLDNWRRGTVRLQFGADEEEAPLNTDVHVQNSSGVLVPGQMPLVEPGMEERTVVVQVSFGFCCSYLEATHQPNEISLTAEEFEAAVEERNAALRRPPVWSFVCVPCCFCPLFWRDRVMRRVCESLNKRYRKRRVRFSTTTRLYQGPQADNMIGKEQNYKFADFLVIEQHDHPQPTSAESTPVKENAPIVHETTPISANKV